MRNLAAVSSNESTISILWFFYHLHNFFCNDLMMGYNPWAGAPKNGNLAPAGGQNIM